MSVQGDAQLVEYFTQTVKRAVNKLWAICGSLPQIGKLLCTVCERRFPVKDSLGRGENFMLLDLFRITFPTVPKQSEGNFLATDSRMTCSSGATAIGQSVSALPSWALLRQKVPKRACLFAFAARAWRLHESGAADVVIRMTVCKALEPRFAPILLFSCVVPTVVFQESWCG